jgi:hypothetical protein
MFAFLNYPSALKLALYIGPGPISVRQTILDHAHANRAVFAPAYKSLGKSWNTIYTVQILKQHDYDEASSGDDLFTKVSEKWNHFLSHDLPRIEDEILRIPLQD